MTEKKQIKKKTSLVARSNRSVARELLMQNIMLPRRVVLQIAEEVGRVVTKSIAVRRKRKFVAKKIENPLFLDTSAIIDMRFFELSKMGVFYGNVVVLESVLGELKNIADSKDDVKKGRGRQALDSLDSFKKQAGTKFIVLPDEKEKIPVDESIIFHAKKYKGRIITCDYNLSKKAKISSVTTINVYELANILKTTAVPGELFWVKIMQKGKGEDQGVGYLPDGTMLVVEHAHGLIGNTVEVMVSRIIQTDAGKILFAKLTSQA